MSDQLNIADQANSITLNTNDVQKLWSILAEHPGIKINDDFVLKLPIGTKYVSREVKESCKVLHFTTEWNFNEVLVALEGHNPKEYQNLFVVIIEDRNFGFLENDLEKCEKIKDILLKSYKARPLILQLKSEKKI